MVQRCTSDAMSLVNFGEEIRRVHRAKVPQRDLLQIWRKVRFPGRLIFRDRRRLAVFAHPGQPMVLAKFVAASFEGGTAWPGEANPPLKRMFTLKE